MSLFCLAADLLQASSGVGLAFMFPGGFLVHQYSYRSICVLGAVLSVLGYAMTGLATYTKTLYISYPYFMHLYFFVAGMDPIYFVIQPIGFLSDTQNCGLHMRLECRERFPRHWLHR